jgi:hypothetical protein
MLFDESSTADYDTKLGFIEGNPFDNDKAARLVRKGMQEQHFKELERLDEASWSALCRFFLQKTDDAFELKLSGTKMTLQLHQIIAIFFCLTQAHHIRLALICDGTGMGKTVEWLATVRLIQLVRENHDDVEASRNAGDGAHLAQDEEDETKLCPSQANYQFECCCVSGSLAQGIVFDDAPALLISPAGGLKNWLIEHANFFEDGVAIALVAHHKTYPFRGQYRFSDHAAKICRNEGDKKLPVGSRRYIVYSTKESFDGAVASVLKKYDLRMNGQGRRVSTLINPRYTIWSVLGIDEIHEIKSSDSQFASVSLQEIVNCYGRTWPLFIGLGVTPFHSSIGELAWMTKHPSTLWDRFKGGIEAIDEALARDMRLMFPAHLNQLKTEVGRLLHKVRRSKAGDVREAMNQADLKLFTRICSEQRQILQMLAIWRTPGSKFRGKPVISLPPGTELTLDAELKAEDVAMIDGYTKVLENRMVHRLRGQEVTDAVVRRLVESQSHYLRPITVFPHLLTMLQRDKKHGGLLRNGWLKNACQENGWLQTPADQPVFSRPDIEELYESSPAMQYIVKEVRAVLQQVAKKADEWASQKKRASHLPPPYIDRVPQFLIFSAYNIVTICVRDCLLLQFPEGLIAPLITSDLTSEQRFNALMRSQGKPDSDGHISKDRPMFIVGTKKILGQSWTLTEANWTFCIEPASLPGVDHQCHGRPRRIGQKYPTVSHLIKTQGVRFEKFIFNQNEFRDLVNRLKEKQEEGTREQPVEL